jgi:hypothetical protein
MPRTRSRRQPPRRRRAGPSGNHDGRSRQNSPDWQGASGPSDQPSCVGGETDEAPRQTAWPAADRLTVGYRRGGDQLRRGILTGEEPTPNAGCRKWRLPAVLRPWPSDSSRPAPNSASAASSWSQAFWEIVPQKHVVTTLELFPEKFDHGSESDRAGSASLTGWELSRFRSAQQVPRSLMGSWPLTDQAEYPMRLFRFHAPNLLVAITSLA